MYAAAAPKIVTPRTISPTEKMKLLNGHLAFNAVHLHILNLTRLRELARTLAPLAAACAAELAERANLVLSLLGDFKNGRLLRLHVATGGSVLEHPWGRDEWTGRVLAIRFCHRSLPPI